MGGVQTPVHLGRLRTPVHLAQAAAGRALSVEAAVATAKRSIRLIGIVRGLRTGWILSRQSWTQCATVTVQSALSHHHPSGQQAQQRVAVVTLAQAAIGAAMQTTCAVMDANCLPWMPSSTVLASTLHCSWM